MTAERAVEPGRSRPPGRDPARDVRGWHRVGNAVALGQFAAKIEQQLAMRSGLHALGDGLTPDGGGQAQHPIQDRQIVGVIEHVVNKAPVNLEAVGRQAFQIGERVLDAHSSYARPRPSVDLPFPLPSGQPRFSHSMAGFRAKH